MGPNEAYSARSLTAIVLRSQPETKMANDDVGQIMKTKVKDLKNCKKITRLIFIVEKSLLVQLKMAVSKVHLKLSKALR